MLFFSDYLKENKSSAIREVHFVDPGARIVDVFHSTLCKTFGSKVLDMEKSRDEADEDDYSNMAAAAATAATSE